MVAARRHWAKLRLPPKFLATLPVFLPPVSKTQLKKLAQAERRAAAAAAAAAASGIPANSQKSSPTPEVSSGHAMGHAFNSSSGGVPVSGGVSQYKINAGLKESSTSGLTMNNVNSLYSLDKSGKPCRRWVKRPRSFKTFTGFKIDYNRYEPEATSDAEEKSNGVEANGDKINGDDMIREESVDVVKTEVAV
ncbi:uncharacterized protein LODBEIA_P29080 [Lodderomyces beijingensis]|uniref:Uncharacterized protein n=1 Tax=Lodderomyces beijingensis TaxID=1775926 RepID=A0ABP0ZKL0_9ASCO